MGIRRFAEAECEMTFEVTQPTRASTKIRSMPGIEAHWIEPSIHLSRPVAATPEPSAIPPATSHRTGQSRARRSSPLITFVINFTGAVAIGAVVEAASIRPGMLPPNAVLFVKTGLCGGFTTFSTFSLETLGLLERGEYAIGGAYALGSLAVCVLGVVAGKMLVRWALGTQAA